MRGFAERVVVALDHVGRDLIIQQPFRISGSALASRARQFAEQLTAAGVTAGEPVALLAKPSVDAFAGFLALRLCGAAVVIVEPLAAPQVSAARLRAAGVRILWAAPAAALAMTHFAGVAHKRGIFLPHPADVPDASIVALGRAIPGVSRSLRRLRLDNQASAAHHSDSRAQGTTHIGDAVIVPTSGTTGNPRSVVHTEASVSAAADAVASIAHFRAGERVYADTLFAVLPAMLAGARITLPHGKLAQRVSDAQSADTIYLTPPELRELLGADVRFSRSRVYAGSAPVSAHTLQRARAAGAREAWGVYALTEMLPVARVEADEKHEWHQAGDLLGRALPGVDVRVVEARLHVRGPMMADRYLGEAPLDWVDTGDLGEVLADGRIVLHGRAKDMILRRAENIYPGLYEPSFQIQGVADALMLGVPSDDGDESVAVLVETTVGVDIHDVTHRLRAVFDSMGGHRPDFLIFSDIPRSGRSRKADRMAAASKAADLLAHQNQSEQVFRC